jgi:spore germination protein PC
MAQLHAYLQRQNEALRDIEQQLKLLRDEWESFRKQHVQPVKHEYRFDLLKVEHLQGNLHIGVKPDGGGTDLGQLAVNNEAISLNPESRNVSGSFEGVRRKVAEFFKHEAADALKQMEEKWSVSLDELHRQFVIQDVERQIDERIRHYLNVQGSADQPAEQLERDIFEKVKADILGTFDVYIQHLNGGKKE